MAEGLGIKEIATSYREYYKLFHKEMEQSAKTLNNECESLYQRLKDNYNNLLDYKDCFKKNFNFDLSKYDEFKNIEYTTGNFYKDAVKLYIFKSKNSEFIYELTLLNKFAKDLKQYKEKSKQLQTVNYCSTIKLEEYNNYLKKYFTEVHKELILNGNAYMISPTIGTVCFSRCKLQNAKPKLDWVATNANKKKLLAEGKTLYDKDAAEFARVNGLDYDGVDYRVYLNKEYVYEMPLIYSKFKNSNSAEFVPSDYRSRSIRGKTNEDLINECNKDTKKIIELPVDIRTKLNMCVSIDTILQTKFIRNENQKPIATSKAYR